jgi:hypothetical protein
MLRPNGATRVTSFPPEVSARTPIRQRLVLWMLWRIEYFLRTLPPPVSIQRSQK